MTTNVDVAPERRIQLAGPRNCRDLGGYLTGAGEMVRWRRVLRSDSLQALSAADAEAVAALLGEAPLAIDLRTPIDRPSSCPFPEVSAPLLDEHCGPDPMFVPGVALEHVYAAMLRKAGARIVGVLSLLANSPTPAVIHCGLGRDRTGLASAVLLGCLGVGDDDIARDYALSASVLPVLIDRGRTEGLPAVNVVYPPEAYDAPEQTMRALLRSVRSDHGSIAGFAMDMGADVELLEELRAKLLW